MELLKNLGTQVERRRKNKSLPGLLAFGIVKPKFEAACMRKGESIKPGGDREGDSETGTSTY